MLEIIKYDFVTSIVCGLNVWRGAHDDVWACDEFHLAFLHMNHKPSKFMLMPTVKRPLIVADRQYTQNNDSHFSNAIT